MPVSTSCQSSSEILPALSSAQYFHPSEPLPKNLPLKFPLNIGPAGKKTVGKSLLIAPINKAGVVLSHPPIKTTPSIG